MATANKASRGMQSSLTRPTKGVRGTAGKSGSVVAALQARTSDTRMIPVADIQPNPDNPVSRSEVGESFVASIRSIGVLVDLLLVPVDVWRRSHPEHDEHLTDQPYVALAGNRRRAGALLAERDEVPARIRTDLDAADADSVMLHENLHREELSPTQEAQAYRRMVERHGLSQRQLAKHTGVSQAQISKRLRLLQLTPTVQELVDAGVIAVEPALELLEVDDDVVESAVEVLVERHEEGRPALVPDAVAEGTVMAKKKRLVAAARQQAEERSAEFVEDVTERLGRGWGEHEISDDDELSAAQAAGELIVSPIIHSWGSGRVAFFTTKPKERKKPEVTDLEKARREDERARKEAYRSRLSFLRDYVTTKKPSTQMRDLVTTHTLRGSGYGADVSRILIELIRAAGLVAPDKDLEYWGVAPHLAALPAKDRERAAWIVALASSEFAARANYVSHWDSQSVGYIEQLIRDGYEATPWEEKRLSDSVAALSKEDADV